MEAGGSIVDEMIVVDMEEEITTGRSKILMLTETEYGKYSSI